MSEFDAFMTEIRRRDILRILDAQNADLSNTSVLTILLKRHSGHDVSDIWVNGQVDWMAVYGLVTVERSGPFTLVRLTDMGRAVARGQAKASGVAEPD